MKKKKTADIREYKRKWYEKNKERVKLYQKRYWLKKLQDVKPEDLAL